MDIKIMKRLREDEISKLKPCPFCGGDGEIFDEYYNEFTGIKGGRWQFSCRDCGLHSSLFNTKKQAIKEWNRRTK